MGGRDKNQANIPPAIFTESESDRDVVEIPAEEGYKHRILSVQRGIPKGRQKILRKHC